MKTYKLSEVCGFVGDAIAAETETYWVQAEIASVSVRGGHCYLDLVEKSMRGIEAKVRATIWANIYALLQPYFRKETGSDLQPGMQVLVEATVDFHAVYGLSLNITDIDPTYTIGDLAKQRQETIARLMAEGVMDMNKSLSMPTIVRRIAVVSSRMAAGYGDFLHQLEEGGYRFETTLFPATMQGEHAAASIIAALDAIAAQEEEWDAVVIIRGGGATTDLTCFDDYNLSNHCAQFPLPVITGIGHTKDVSVLDLVAFAPLKTPTAVAQYFVDGRIAQAQRLRDLEQRLRRVAENIILRRRHTIEMLTQRLAMCSPERIYRMGYSLVTSGGKVVRSAADLQPGETITTHFIDGEKQAVIQ